MIKLRVNFGSGILKFPGKTTGKLYTYNPVTDKGEVYVDETDADELKTRKIKTGCGCVREGEAGTPEKFVSLFEEIE